MATRPQSVLRRLFLAALAATLVVPAAPAVGKPEVKEKLPKKVKQPKPYSSCSYLEAGALGPEGNVLAVSIGAFDVPRVVRAGDSIFVRAGWRDVSLNCGSALTVSNIDEISVQSLHPWSLGMDIDAAAIVGGGATPEADGTPEIEVVDRTEELAIVEVIGGPGADRIVVDGGSGGPQTINVNASEPSPDADVTLQPTTQTGAFVKGGGGPDELSIVNSVDPDDGFEITLKGLAGDDILTGGPGADELRGGTGADRITAGAGSDFIVDGPGSDLILGEDGKDKIYSQPGGRDRLLCGPKRDRVAVWRGDRRKGCEIVEKERIREFDFVFPLPDFLS